MFAPVKTPAAIVERLNREPNQALKADDMRAKMLEQGAIGSSRSAADFAKFVQREQTRFARIVQLANIRE